MTLLLLPGLAADAGMWEHQVGALAAWSPKVGDTHMRCDTIEAMAAALLEENPGDLVLCGASMGGMVAMEATRQAPGRVRGLALLGTVASPEMPEMRQVREAAIVLFGQGRLAEVLEPNVPLAFHPDNAEALKEAYLALILRAGAEQLVRQNRAVIARPDARLHLPAVRCPVLVMVGEADQLTPRACSEQIVALVPHAQVEVVAGAGHMLTMEQPERVSARLQAWLQTL